MCVCVCVCVCMCVCVRACVIVAGAQVCNFDAELLQQLLDVAVTPPMLVQNWMDPMHQVLTLTLTLTGWTPCTRS